jgi:serine/threonine protein phosphatase PrpC/GTP-binding protein EngB required for normal cell division
MTNADSALAGALNELAALGSAQDREMITALRDRLDAARLRVLVAGEAKRGKSTLINALLGSAVLPAGVTPLTAVATTVRYGGDPHTEVRFADGHEEKQPITALPDLVTERGNPGNRRRIASVTVYLDVPLLAGGAELVDTPGTGSVFAWDTAAAHEALETMDAAVFVLTADPPVSAAERDLYAKVTTLSVATFTVLNKADHLDEAGLTEAAEFTRRVLAEAAGGPGAPARIYVLSARAALNGGDRGFAAFAADFKAYLASRRMTDLRSSAGMQARRIARSLLDEVALIQRAAQLTAGDAAERVARFTERLAEVTVRGKDAVAVVNAESARLLMALNDAAEADGRRLGRSISQQLEEVLGTELRTAPPADIERQGRERLVALTLAAADTWRAQRQELIEERLARTDTRLAADLTAALEVLRDSAAELLGLDLAVPEPGGRLAEDRRFFYTTGEETGQTELLAGAIRRRLPGELGRHSAREHLRREAPGLAESQIGRARADLQYRLSEASRALARSMERRYAEATGRMQAALQAAEELRSASTAEAAGKERELSERAAAVRHALALLGDAGKVSGQTDLSGKDNDMTEPARETLTIRYAVRSDIGLERANNEDAAYAGRRLLAVADGMGGHAAGEVASAAVIEALRPLDSQVPPGELLNALGHAVRHAEEALRDMVAANPSLTGMGTTVTALLRSGSRLGLAHIGDTRAYLTREGEVLQITHDHTMVQSLLDEGKITEEEAASHPRRMLLLQALDGQHESEPDLQFHDARAGDRYLLSTDGLHATVPADAIAHVLLTVTDPEQAVADLIKLAIDNGAPDNVTCIVADIVPAAQRQAE